jgi:leader peptidase (prepilin peptidase) / N-methyltransferase
MIQIIGTIFVAALGLAFGSFLNACLSRWPAEESVVQPRSHCRQCSHTLSWWENVPLVSWLVLRGRCRECRAWIGWRYPLVELAIATLWTISALRFFGVMAFLDLSGVEFYNELAVTIGKMIFYWLLAALAVLDLENLWLPDRLTLPGAALGFGFAILGRFLTSSHSIFTPSLLIINTGLTNLISILIAAGIILLIRWIYWLIRRQEGMGLGDAKLMALLAAWLGLPQTLLAFGVGLTLGAGAALVLLALPKLQRESGGWATQSLPFGTFLCIGGVISSLWGQQCIADYLRWAGF